MRGFIRRARVVGLCAALGGLAASAVAAPETTTYEYDALGRLVGAIDNSGPAVVYGYDAVNNRIQVANGGAYPELIPSNFTPSSTSGTLSGLTTPNGMRDGDYVSSTSIHVTDPQAQPWIRANFTPSVYVDHICVAPASSATIGPANTNGANVEYSTDNGASWRYAATVSGAAAGVCGVIALRINVTNVRLILTGSGQIAAGDFRFWSIPAGGSLFPPSVANKALTVNAGSSGSVDVTPSGAWTALAIAGPPRKGAAAISGSTATYTPGAGVSNTTDAFTYTAQDPAGQARRPPSASRSARCRRQASPTRR